MTTNQAVDEVVLQRIRQKHDGEEQHRVWLDALLDERDLARITGLSLASVRRWRLFRQGPKYLKIGAAVRYRAEDVRVWLETRPTGGGR